MRIQFLDCIRDEFSCEHSSSFQANSDPEYSACNISLFYRSSNRLNCNGLRRPHGRGNPGGQNEFKHRLFRFPRGERDQRGLRQCSHGIQQLPNLDPDKYRDSDRNDFTGDDDGRGF
jgi:hypothetical protein